MDVYNKAKFLKSFKYGIVFTIKMILPAYGENDILCRFSKYGGGGIRTHGALADTLVFKTRALNHSTTPPGEKY